MARARLASQYVCQVCAASVPRWEGQCRSCGSWNTLVETLMDRPGSAATRRLEAAVHAAADPVPLALLAARPSVRTSVGLPEVDRVLGGGLVPGSLILLGGEPGIGKSTLVLQVAHGVATARGLATANVPQRRPSVLYVSGEESGPQLHLRAERLGLVGPEAVGEGISVLATTDVDVALVAAGASGPDLLIVDSVQTMTADGLEGPAGSVGQVREVAARLGRYAREAQLPVLLVGQVTKDGTLAGPRALEHLVDAVLMLEGDRYGQLRLLRALKNRHGATDEIGVLEMSAGGLREVDEPAAVFLSPGARDQPGVVVAATLEGTRPMLVEVQALVAGTSLGPPRRTVAGIRPDRLALLVAVLSRRAGVDLGSRDVYASLAGGMSVDEPALDLALALALASSMRDVPLAAGTVAFGEVSLLGEVRQVRGQDRRLREAARLGFSRALVPVDGARSSGQASKGGIGLDVVPVASLREALGVALPDAGGTTG